MPPVLSLTRNKETIVNELHRKSQPDQQQHRENIDFRPTQAELIQQQNQQQQQYQQEKTDLAKIITTTLTEAIQQQLSQQQQQEIIQKLTLTTYNKMLIQKQEIIKNTQEKDNLMNIL